MGHKAQPKYDRGCEDPKVGPLEAILVVHHGDTSDGLLLLPSPHFPCLSILFIGFLRQEYWSGLPFPPPVDHVLLEFLTKTCLSWVAWQDS